MEVNHLLVLQSDFGLLDGAVAAMTGVSLSVDPTLRVHDLTHNIPPFDTYEASFRLLQAVPYWPKGTVFVSVVDPGVGSSRKSVVALTKSGHYIVSPDNGTLTHLGQVIGFKEIREISEEVGRRSSNEASTTFHGRDVYAYTGALLASGKVPFNEIGEKIRGARYKVLKGLPASNEGNKIIGTIETLDGKFGSLWTNISREMFEEMGIQSGDQIDVTIYNGNARAFRTDIPFTHTFAEVEIGEALCYVNSMDHIGIAINQGNFSKAYNIGTRTPWRVEFTKK